MADEPSLGELSRRLDRAERDWDTDVARIRQEHDADIQRLQREHSEDLRKLREDVIRPMQQDIEAVQRRPWLTVGRGAVIATAVIAFAALMVQAWGTLKGVK